MNYEKMKEETYQRLKKDLLEEINDRIFKERKENNQELIGNISDEIIEEAEIIAQSKITKEQANSLISINVNEMIRERIDETLKGWIKKDMRKIVDEQQKIIANFLIKKSEEFMKQNIVNEMWEAFDKYKDIIFERKFKEKARDQLLQLVSLSNLDASERLRKEYREVARSIKNEILQELKEDLNKIKMGK